MKQIKKNTHHFPNLFYIIWETFLNLFPKDKASQNCPVPYTVCQGMTGIFIEGYVFTFYSPFF